MCSARTVPPPGFCGVAVAAVAMTILHVGGVVEVTTISFA
jgi:hypothetical protein